MAQAESDISKTLPVSVRLPPELNQQVADIAQALDRPKWWVIGQACNRFLGWCEDRGLTLTAIRPHDVATYIEELQAAVPALRQSDCLHHLQRQRCDPLGKETRDDVASCASFCVKEARYARGIH